MDYQVVKAFLEEISNGDLEYYFFYANPFPWDETEDIPYEPAQTVEQQLITKSNIIGLKKISGNDIVLGLEKYVWSSGTQYKQYEFGTDTLPLSGDEEDSSYVFTSDNNVYLCLDNGSKIIIDNDVSKIEYKQTESSYEPNHTSGKMTYDDGYVWQYMFTIESATLRKFNTPDYVPVDLSSGTNPQSIASAIPGTVDRIDILADDDDVYGGENFDVQYRDENGDIQSLLEVPIYVNGNGDANASAEINIIAVSSDGEIDIGSNFGPNALNGVIDNLYPNNNTEFELNGGFAVTDWGSGYTYDVDYSWIPIMIRQESSINNVGFTPAYGIARVNADGVLDAIRITRKGAGYEDYKKYVCLSLA